MYQPTYSYSVSPLEELKQAVKEELLARHPKAHRRGEWIDTYSPFRKGDNDHCFSFNTETGGWIDEVTGETGNVYELADVLGIPYQRGDQPSQPIPLHPKKPAIAKPATTQDHKTKKPEPPLDWDNPTHTYNYFDENGNRVFFVLRWDTPDGKELRQGHEVNGELVKSLDGVGKPYPVYALESIKLLPPDAPIFFVEGEKCVERLQDEGAAATTTAGGARNLKNTDLSPLYGHPVFILPDQDAVGQTYAQEVAGAFVGHSPSVKIVDLPPMGEKADVVDYFNAGYTMADLDELVRQAAPIDPHSPTASCLKHPRLPLITCRELAKRPCKPMDYLIKGNILPAHESTMLFAPPKSFKTFLSLEMAVAIATGKPFLERHTVTQGKVILIDLEDHIDRLRERIEAIMGRYGRSFEDIGDELVIYDKASLIGSGFTFDGEAITQLSDVIKEMQPALVVVDNLRKALPPDVDENSNAHVNPLINLQPGEKAMLGCCASLASDSGRKAKPPGNHPCAIKLARGLAGAGPHSAGQASHPATGGAPSPGGSATA